MNAPRAVETDLDYLAAKAAKGMCDVIGVACKPDKEGKTQVVKAKEAENLFQKALGILQESGVFACGLFLLSRSGTATAWKDAGAEEVAACYGLSTLIGLAKGGVFSAVQPEFSQGALPPADVNAKKRALIDHMVKVAGTSLDRLLLIKQVWEQTLIYARFMAKARKEKEAA
jgi:hypothetical protein